jgi:hypothetical protein
MNRKMLLRLFPIFTGALLGYLWGWIWGWSLTDPNRDIWALAAVTGACAGMLLGVRRIWERAGVPVLCATVGLYLGWLLRTICFGDVPGGWGAALMALACLAGCAAGLAPGRREDPVTRAGLLGAVYAGFFGGFLVDVVILDLWLGLATTHTILSQAPEVVMLGILGGSLAMELPARLRREAPSGAR